ncbi:MAG: DUF2279 domain-containing protein [Candidatus Marinimicrobia bacterium]|nr:DUF2279 domain-containing protein [Candidatus Neomarinimicrobiota bacterium]MBT3847744.1 DUF2279 domain-containing protein [Candidatus Neomarinimicrobiota bacterium]MBT4155497.1 DUF2279 domain-containing protein [Candidatus Neomarinimicrobiota bacterium]MBT5114754.1 DUF2279 domain-containing protein [Candidatus Neomarinimicrobiota bacterium]MBT5748070.1 DUF2279 domain-containing protein [Candidatus Neomarinimicrobiota bacterium]
MKSVLIIAFLIPCGNFGSTIVHKNTVQNISSKDNDKWTGIDKIQHFSYSCLVSLGVQYVFVNKVNMEESAAIPVSLGVSFMAGVAKEIQDNKSKNGFFSKKDMVANGLGLLFAWFIISLP